MTNCVLNNAQDAFGAALAEYDDVALLRPAIFTRADSVGESASAIKLSLLPSGAEATIIGIGR